MPTKSIPWAGTAEKYGNIWTAGARRFSQAELEATVPTITGLEATFVGTTAYFTWDRVEDLRPINYEVRKGNSWSTATVIGTIDGSTETFIFPSVGDGVYHFAAYTSLQGITTYGTPVTALITGDSLGSLRTFSKTAQPIWQGTFSDGARVQDGRLTLYERYDILTDQDILSWYDINRVYNIAVSGTWVADPIYMIDLGKSVQVNISRLIETSAQNVLAADILNNPDLITSADIFGFSTSTAVTARAQYRVGNASGVFGSWLDFPPTVTTSIRYLETKIELDTDTPDVVPYANKFQWTVTAAPVYETFDSLLVSLTGIRVTYANNAGTTALKKFAIINGDSQTSYTTSSDGATGFNLQILRAGVPVARTVSILAQEY